MNGTGILFIGNVVRGNENARFVDAYFVEEAYNSMARHYEDRAIRQLFIEQHSVQNKKVSLENETVNQMVDMTKYQPRLPHEFLYCQLHVDTRNYFLSNGGKWCLEELGIEVVDIGNMIVKRG